MGAAIASQLALDAPERVASLALICPAGLGEAINTGYTEGFAAAESRRDLKPVVEQLFHNPELVTRSLLEDLLKYKRIDGVQALLRELGSALFQSGRQRATPGLRLSDPALPVLVVWGESDRIIPALQAANAPPHAQVEVLKGAGHLVMLEKATEVNALLRKHLAL
jgi:pyruvate dehydrogenase E2 component (dihydrolipoamide acetyltransferase)